MVSSEVQRTLVKSPPELWAELSDPAALARHLGELGEIRITRVDPEQKVEWQAEDTSGTVLIDPSGWGTRVTLTATREIRSTGSPQALDEPVQPLEAEPEQQQAEPEQQETEPERELGRGDEEQDFMPELSPRRGFFGRLFRRRRALAQPSFQSREGGVERSPEPSDAFAAVTRALAPETFAAARPFATEHLPAAHAWNQHESPAVDESPTVAESPEQPHGDEQQTGDACAESGAAEEVEAEQVTAVLTSMLDRLGAAHHRPFSRG